MNTATHYALAALTLALTGSASIDSEGPAQASSSNTASIVGRFHRDTFLTWQRHSIDSIDGRKVEFGFFSDSGTSPVAVEPGHRKLVVNVLFNHDSKQFSATVPLEVELKPSTKYTINAVVLGTQIEAWLDSVTTGERVSEKFRATCKLSVYYGYAIRTGPCPPQH